MSKTKLYKAALAAFTLTNAHFALAPITRGRGVIFMLHRVTPEPVEAFEPNRILKIKPDFLEEVILEARSQGFEFVTLDEAHRRILSNKPGSRLFACMTLDDGYRDNFEHAYPVFQKHNVPATIYIPGNYPDGDADLWWITLERCIRLLDNVTAPLDGVHQTIPCATLAQKEACFDRVYWWLRQIPEVDARLFVQQLAEIANVDSQNIARELIMNWDEVRRLAADPLITIGAHTSNHFALSKLDRQDCRRELFDGIKRIETELGATCRHFAYPYGDAGSAREREFEMAGLAGLSTAVTTRKGVVYSHHSNSMMSLPRLSLNGDFQDIRYVSALMSGAPFAIWNSVQELRQASQKVASLMA